MDMVATLDFVNSANAEKNLPLKTLAPVLLAGHRMVQNSKHRRQDLEERSTYILYLPPHCMVELAHQRPQSTRWRGMNEYFLTTALEQ